VLVLLVVSSKSPDKRLGSRGVLVVEFDIDLLGVWQSKTGSTLLSSEYEGKL
jgi:hypothetical protein